MNNFLNSEQKIIYAEKRENNFLNNAKRRIMLCKIVEVVYAKNKEQFYLMQKTYFMNAVSRFEYTENIMCRVQILLMLKQILSLQKIDSIIVKFKHEKYSDFGFKFRKRDSTRCFM